MYSLSLSVATPSVVVYFEYTTTRVSSDHSSHTFYYFLLCFGNGTFLCFCGCGGLVCFFFVAPLLAVFRYASAFNQDVSKWNTGAVTNMQGSKCTLSPSLWPRLPLWCFLNIRQLELHLITIFTRCFFFLSLLHSRLSQYFIEHTRSILTFQNGISVR